MAAIQTERRNRRVEELIAQGEQWDGKLVEQDGGVKRRGRKLSDSGAKARFYHAVCEAKLGKIIQVDLAAELFCYDIDANAQRLAEMMDGKLLLVTNTQDMAPEEIIALQVARRHRARGSKCSNPRSRLARSITACQSAYAPTPRSASWR